MARTPEFKAGTTIKLDLNLKGRQRLMVGLSWNAVDSKWMGDTDKPGWAARRNEDEINDAIRRISYYLYDSLRSFAFLAHIRSAEKIEDGPGREKDYNMFDLDLLCFALDGEGNKAAYSGPASPDVIDKAEVIYHSGENYSGYSGFDDEQIHVEMNTIPESYENLFFIVASDSKFSLDEVNGVAVRLVDCRTEENILETAIRPPPNFNAYAYLFGRLYRKDGEWLFQEIGEFTDGEQDWPAYLKKYL